MKKIFFLLVGMGWFTSALALENGDVAALLNKISFPLRVEKWVTTKTADVFVSVNSAVSDAGIEKIQTQVLGQLAQLSNQAEWHVVSYSRQQDKSGLESIQMIAEARLPQTELGGLRDRAKAISKPGNTFTIDSVAFTPSDEEVTQANTLLRGMIYQQAKAEIDALNKVYTDQKYYLYNIEFNAMPVIMPMAAMAVTRNAALVAAPPLNVGNKMEMTANVTVASIPEMLAKKTPLIN